jgi:hypothetical protein
MVQVFMLKGMFDVMFGKARCGHEAARVTSQ